MQNIIQECIKMYYIHGTRSNKKLVKLHEYISNEIKKELRNTDYKCHTLPNKEWVVKGEYYNKKVDVCVTKNDIPYGIVNIKFIMSNYSQNSNNYFESLYGETSNLKKENLIQWYIMIIFDNIPYYDVKNDIKKLEKMTKKSRYDKLVTNNMLDNLSIITIKNENLLIHPNKAKDVNKINFSDFLIIECYPISFESTLGSFCRKIIKNE
jgi:hypothetical protein